LMNTMLMTPITSPEGDIEDRAAAVAGVGGGIELEDVERCHS
jgi:hypothetical protein